MGKVLIIADLSEKQYFAIPRGLELAEKLGHAVEVVAFIYAPLQRLKIRASEQKIIKARLLEERREVVQARIDKYAVPDQQVALKVIWGKDIAGWVVKRCAAARYDAIVKTGHRTESLVYTPTDWQLLRECPAPVLLVADRKWNRTKPVLAALDLSSSVKTKLDLNHHILQAAIEMAEKLDSDLRIISAIEVPTLLADMDLVDPASYAAEIKQEMMPEIETLAARYNLPVNAFRVKRGPVEKVITSEAARVRAQLVVMGTRARTGVRAKLLGNTAEKVLSHLKTDVLALKP